MSQHKFNVTKLEKLNNPERLNLIDIDKIISELNLPREPVIADIGVGTGIFLKELLNKLPNSTGYGFDIAKEMVEWINDNIPNELIDRLKVNTMCENEIPLAGNTADLVFMITVHHELENASLLLSDINRVLKDKGKLLICDWKEGIHKHFVTKEQILKDLEISGFKNITEVDASEKLTCLICS